MTILRLYPEVLGGHTHLRVFVNGALAGRLVLRNEEFTGQELRVEVIRPEEECLAILPVNTKIYDGDADERD